MPADNLAVIGPNYVVPKVLIVDSIKDDLQADSGFEKAIVFSFLSQATGTVT